MQRRSRARHPATGRAECDGDARCGPAVVEGLDPRRKGESKRDGSDWLVLRPPPSAFRLGKRPENLSSRWFAPRRCWRRSARIYGRLSRHDPRGGSAQRGRWITAFSCGHMAPSRPSHATDASMPSDIPVRVGCTVAVISVRLLPKVWSAMAWGAAGGGWAGHLHDGPQAARGQSMQAMSRAVTGPARASASGALSFSCAGCSRNPGWPPRFAWTVSAGGDGCWWRF